MESTHGDTTLMVRRGQSWRPLAVQNYENEDELQRLLHENPSLLPGVSAGAIAAREVPVPGVGAVDLVVIDVDGAITLIECKLRSNQEIHRKVVGQILAYASGLWRLPYSDFEPSFVAAVGRSIDSLLGASAHEDEDGRSAIPATIAQALQAGRFRLCIAVDEITDELRSIVEYLNTHLSEGIEALLFEVGIVTDGDTQILVPRTFGGESARLKSPGGGIKKKWTFDDVLAEIRRLSGPEVVASIRRIYEFVRENGWPCYSGKGATPTASFYTRLGGKTRALITIYPYDSGAYERSITLNFGSLRGAAAESQLAGLLEALLAVPALASHLARVRDRHFEDWPIIPMNALRDGAVVDTLLQALRVHLSAAEDGEALRQGPGGAG